AGRRGGARAQARRRSRRPGRGAVRARRPGRAAGARARGLGHLQRPAASLARPARARRDPMSVDAAYAEVERVTREQARNFAYGIRVLPREKRRAISAIYAFARRV